jgi:hypothetical protein
MKGRMSSVIVAPVRANDPSQAVDCAYFERNPNTVEYIRDVLPGEAPKSISPGSASCSSASVCSASAHSCRRPRRSTDEHAYTALS